MSAEIPCEACGGMLQEPNELRSYSGKHRKWLCKKCMRDIDVPPPTKEESDALTEAARRRIAEQHDRVVAFGDNELETN